MDDFDRDVYCLAGLPFDAINMTGAVHRGREAAEQSARCFISTPNLNFLISSQNDIEFRESVIQSDLSIADGMPLVWMARLLGIPIRERVAGSSFFELLGTQRGESGRKLSVFFFGGAAGVAEQACLALNAGSAGFDCAGYKYPGFGSIEDMSGDEAIGHINDSGADFLVVSLGAAKGQAWIMRNRARITVPIISHLGAVVNFVAGTVSRAPVWMQRFGLEWLWRIKEEPSLFSRYLRDGLGFLHLLATRIFPYAVWLRFHAYQAPGEPTIELSEGRSGLTIALAGAMCSDRLEGIRGVFRQAASTSTIVTLNLEQASYLDAAFLGLVLLLAKQVRANGYAFHLVHVPKALLRVFYWCGVEYLLSDS